MRLIDADRLRAKITAMVTRPHQFMYEIERAPTVEAIPIEWINDWLNKGRNAKYFIPMMEMIKEWENTEWQQ